MTKLPPLKKRYAVSLKKYMEITGEPLSEIQENLASGKLRGYVAFGKEQRIILNQWRWSHYKRKGML